MGWIQAHIVTGRDKAFLAELLFEGLDAVSVTMADAEDQPVFEPDPGEVRLWEQTRITGLFPGETDLEWLRQAIRDGAGELPLAQLHIERLEDQVWERVWLEHFHPMRFGDRLWICPTGSEVKVPDAVVIDLDPGLAFGTGTHPTTALCLEWLDARPPSGLEVIDYGCGSGILAIAAAKLGARHILAVDHDPQALEASDDNARRNGVRERLTIALSEDADDKAQADLILANILSEVLIRLEAKLAARVRPGGRIVLSGILQEQAREVHDAFAADFELHPPRIKDDWVLIEGVRR